MENTMINSQSAAAVNSAKTSFSFYSKKNDSPRTNYEVDWQDHTIAGVAREAIAAYGTDAKMEIYDDGYFFDLSVKRIDGQYYVGVIVWNKDATKVLMHKCIPTMYHRMTKKAIESFAWDIWDMYNYAWDMIKAAEISNKISGNAEAEASEAPALDAAPMLEKDDDITDEGYSARGLAYAKEHTNGVSMADIIRAVAEEHWNFESVVKESQWTRFTNDSFRDLIWSTCWAEYLVGHADEALEAETRYVMDFDSVYDDLFDELWPYMSTYDDSCGGCELWVNAWYVVERAAEIIENTGARCIDWDNFPNYVMDAFLSDLYGFDTFTERVMSELEGGDIVSIMPYDDGLHLSFVDDEAEVAA